MVEASLNVVCVEARLVVGHDHARQLLQGSAFGMCVECLETIELGIAQPVLVLFDVIARELFGLVSLLAFRTHQLLVDNLEPRPSVAIL